MTATTNQNRHFYVVNAVDTVNENAAVGTVELKTIDNGVEKTLYFLYKESADTILKSDYIQLKNLNYVKAVAAEDLRTALKSVEVALDANVNGGEPISGQDYVLRICFRQFYGMSDEDQYFKDVAVHATSGMTAKNLFDKMLDALKLAFAREIGATKSANPYLTFSVTGSGNSAKLVITEKEQEWALGIATVQRVLFDVQPTTVFLDGDDAIWGTVTDVTPDKATIAAKTTNDGTFFGDGKQIADLEWFCMGERGDQYRMIGYPNYIPTKYLVDETKEYNVLEIHHGFTDTGVNSYRSEKDITFVAEDAEAIDDLVSAINSAAGLNIPTLANDDDEEEGNDQH